MTKMLDMAGSSAVTRPLTAVPASLVERIEAGAMKGLGLYRALAEVEIGRASEHGARWWSRRLVEVYEQAGLVHLDKEDWS